MGIVLKMLYVCPLRSWIQSWLSSAWISLAGGSWLTGSRSWHRCFPDCRKYQKVRSFWGASRLASYPSCSLPLLTIIFSLVFFYGVEYNVAVFITNQMTADPGGE